MKNILCLVACLCGITVNAGNWQLTILDSTNNESCTYGINSYGFAVGYEMQNGSAVPCIWSPDGSSIDLPRLPVAYYGSVGCAYAINDNFIVAGIYDYWNPSDEFHLGQGYAGYWYFDSTQTNFVSANIGETGRDAARAINNQGLVAGWHYLAWGDHFSFTINGTTNSQSSSGDYESRCFGINDSGNACGDYADWIWPGPVSPCFFKKQANGYYSYSVNSSLVGSSAMAINNQNEMVGFNATQGFYWNPDTNETISFGNGTRCYAINDRSAVVGTSNSHACMWTSSSNSFTACDLNSLISNTNIVLEKAFGINANSQIVGQLINKSTGVRSGFLLSPLTGVKAKLEKTPGGATLSWDSKFGHNYSIRYSRDLVNWDDIPGIYIAEEQSAYVVVPTDEPSMFFQVFDHAL